MLNGEYVSAEFHDSRPERSEKLLVIHLKKGKNQLLVKTYNRYSRNLSFGFLPVDDWTVYRFDCDKTNTGVEKLHRIEVKAADRVSGMVPMSLENIRIEL